MKLLEKNKKITNKQKTKRKHAKRQVRDNPVKFDIHVDPPHKSVNSFTKNIMSKFSKYSSL